MAEAVLLTTPAVTPASSTTDLRVAQLLLSPARERFMLTIRGTRGEVIEVTREGPEAVTLLKALNKANGSVKSLERRALEWFLSQPEGAAWPGTITGAPD